MADSPWELDGTQPPPPPAIWDDPVSGLVTGTGYAPEPLRIDVVKPVEPDMAEVRRAVDAALAEEEWAGGGLAIPAPRSASSPTAMPPGMVAPNPRAGWPRPPSVRQIPRLRPRPVPPTRLRRVHKRSGGPAVATAIGVLVAIGVFITILLLIIGSLVDTVSSIFG